MEYISQSASERFETAKKKVLGIQRDRQGIGTFGEKTVHAIVKHYMEPDTDYHEIPVDGYVADIYREGNIIEIQTANFNRLREKLGCFLKHYEVTVVYPIPHIKYLRWLDEESGSITAGRKSPKKGTPYHAFKELYRIKNYLSDEHLHLCLLLIDLEEIRLLNGWSRDKKKGSVRYDRIPLGLAGELRIDGREDYMQMLPIELGDTFTAADYAKAAHVSSGMAGIAVQILRHLDIIRMIGKQGRAYLYEINDSI